jgi:integrase/recombinase XerD
MQNKPLIELLQDLEQEMLRLGYTQGSMQFYRRRWQMLLRFAEERDEAFFSESLGMDFLEKNFHILEKDANRKFSQAEAQELRIIRVIGDFQLHHTILRRYHNYKHREILTEPHFLVISDQFKSYCVNKG